MNHMKTTTPLIPLTICLFLSCSKDTEPVNPVIPGSNAKVYTAGTLGDSSLYSQGAYWYNNSLIKQFKTNYEVKAIQVIGSDVYLLTNEYGAGGKSVAKYWKNDQEFSLSDGTYESSANSMSVHNGSVYVTGTMKTSSGFESAYWINGQKTSLPVTFKAEHVNAFFFDSLDIYKAGSENILGQFSKAKYWKNDQEVFLTDGKKEASALSIVVEKGNVYVLGSESGRIVVWKNGQASSLTDGTTSAMPTSLAVENGNVYVSGTVYNASGTTVAKYWMNGKAIDLTNGNFHAGAESIAVDNENVFVAGWENDASGNSIAKYWKNGKPILLKHPGFKSKVFSIALVK